MKPHRLFSPAPVLLLALVALLCLLSFAMARESKVDWTQMVVTATGVGSASGDIRDMSQARLMAERAALLDARRNLLEVVGGVHIDSETRVADFMALSDAVAARVKGILRNSRASDTRVLADGSVEVTVSMPLTGELSQALLETTLPGAAPELQGLEQRVRRLEEQVRQLEERLGHADKTGAEQRVMLELLTHLVATWGEWLEKEQSLVLPAASVADTRRLAELERAVREQARKQARLAARLTARMEELSTRLARFEHQTRPSTGGSATMPTAASRADTTPKAGASGRYTGLVVDATGLGFLPALRPRIYGNGVLLYPGEAARQSAAVKNGYARYYRNLSLAQQNSLSGSLPLTVRAQGLYMGDKRSLLLRERDAALVRDILATPGNFLERCRVVIVF